MNPKHIIKNKGAQIFALVIALVAGVLVSYAFIAKADPGVSVFPTTLEVTEGGTTGFSVNLDTIPTDPVTITPVYDPTLFTVTPSSATVTDTGSTLFSVETLANDDYTGNIGETITFDVTSSDVTYNGLGVASVDLTILDDDIPGVTVEIGGRARTVTISEGSPSTISVVLDRAPASDVTVAMTSGGIVLIDPASLVFTPLNWDTPQTVTLTVEDDAVDLGNRSDSISFSVTSDDPDYNGLAVNDLTGIQIADNDTVVPSTLTLSDTRTNVMLSTGFVDVTVALAAMPSSDATVYARLESGAYATIAPESLVFTARDWDTPQTIRISASSGAGTSDTINFSLYSCVEGGKLGPICSTDRLDETIAVSIVDDSSDDKPEDDSSGGDDDGDTPTPAPVRSNGANVSKAIVLREVAQQTTKSSTPSPTSSRASASPSSTTGSSSSRILAPGVKDSEVIALQKILNVALASRLQVDGIYGEATKKAVTALQLGTGIKADGIVGPATRSTIDVLKTAVSEESPSSLQVGSRGDRVRILQRLLAVKGIAVSVDGIFGPMTQNAIVQFQMERGLTIDGIAGPQTFLELQK